MNSIFPWIILLAPLFSAAVITLFTLRWKALSSFISVAAVLVSFVCSCLIFSRSGISPPAFTWIELGGGFKVEVEAEGQGLGDRLAAVPGVQKVEPAGANRWRLTSDRDVRPEAAAAVVAAGGRLQHLSVEAPSLEAIYTSYFHKVHEGERHAA